MLDFFSYLFLFGLILVIYLLNELNDIMKNLHNKSGENIELDD